MTLKSLIKLAALLLILNSCGDNSCNSGLTPAEKLIAHLEMQVEADKIMYGHQDDYMYGHSWKLEDNAAEFVKSDVKDVCGAYPAVSGMDLGGIELGWTHNLDRNDFNNMRASAVAHHQRGGVVTF